MSAASVRTILTSMIDGSDMTDHARELAETLVKLRSIYVPTEHTHRVCQVVDELVARKRAGVTGDHGSALIVGDSHVGKSASIKHAMKRHGMQGGTGSSILHITLPPNVTRRSMLIALGNAVEERGYFNPLHVRANEAQLQKASFKAIELMGADAVVMDEAHHIKYGKKEDAGYWIGEMIKTFLIEGPCPVILCGVGAHAKRPYLENRQLMNRTVEIVELKPFDIDADAERGTFKSIFKAYFDEMEALQVVEDVTFLKNGKFFGAFFMATGGSVGEGVRLLEGAVTQMMRAERRRFRFEDFFRSFASLALTAEYNTANPFQALCRAEAGADG